MTLDNRPNTTTPNYIMDMVKPAILTSQDYFENIG